MAPYNHTPGLAADMASRQIVNVLFLCDDNSCRSPIAEALLNFAGEGRFWAFSAGFAPARKIDPMAIELMRRAGIPCGGLTPKVWRGFTTPNAPRIDVVICLDTRIPLSAATLLPGNPIIACWPIENPATVQGSDVNRCSAYGRTLRKLEGKILKLTGSAAAATPSNKHGRELLTEAA